MRKRPSGFLMGSYIRQRSPAASPTRSMPSLPSDAHSCPSPSDNCDRDAGASTPSDPDFPQWGTKGTKTDLRRHEIVHYAIARWLQDHDDDALGHALGDLQAHHASGRSPEQPQ